MKFITAISRILVGCLFIFSGFIKANDPIGFSYKLVEYYGVFGIGFLNSTAEYQAIIICVAEIVLGICVLIGTRMRLTAWLLLGMIVFFTFLTGFTAIFNWFYENPEAGLTNKMENLFGFSAGNIYYMKDCGCFGDFIKLTPWQSFYKDLVLLVLILVIFLRRNHIRPFLPKIMQTNVIVFFTIACTVFSFYCVNYLPLFNFLYWKNGNDVKPLMVEVAPEVTFFFTYEKNGQRYYFKDTELPDDLDTYTYIDRKDSVTKAGIPAKIHDFYPANSQGTPMADSIFSSADYKLLVISYDLDLSRKRGYKKLKDLTTDWIAKGKPVYAFTSTPLDQAEAFRHEQQLPFEFLSMDRTAIKSIMRSNPGVILMYKSTVVNQWPATAIPTTKKLERVLARHQKKAAR